MTGALYIPTALTDHPIAAAGYALLMLSVCAVYLYAMRQPLTPPPQIEARKPRVYRRAAMVEVYRPRVQT